MKTDHLDKFSSVWTNVELPVAELERLERDGLVDRKGAKSNLFRLTLRGHKAKLGLFLEPLDAAPFIASAS